MKAPWIVCAAMTFDINNIGIFDIITSPRHFDTSCHSMLRYIKDTYGSYDVITNPVQGFVDQFGKFYTRTEAWKIAEANGQIRFRVGGDTANGGTLYSENLY